MTQPREPGRTLLTVGHSNREPEDFLGLLAASGVEVLVDVRRHPGSRRVPWTNKPQLEQLLAESGVGYLHLEELGGRRRPEPDSLNSGWRVEQFQGYADHMRTPEFLSALARLEEEGSRRRAAVMCAEAQWWRCHRRLVADALLVRGWTVLHIMGERRAPEHELTDFAAVEDGALIYR